MALPTFMSGSAAEAMLRNSTDATKGLIQAMKTPQYGR